LNEINRNRKKRKKIRARKQWPRRNITTAIAAAVFVYIAVCFGSLMYKHVSMNNRLQHARKQHEEMIETKKRLENEKIKLQDPEYVEKMARKDLHYMKDNEVYIKITPDLAREPGADSEH